RLLVLRLLVLRLLVLLVLRLLLIVARAVMVLRFLLRPREAVGLLIAGILRLATHSLITQILRRVAEILRAVAQILRATHLGRILLVAPPWRSGWCHWSSSLAPLRGWRLRVRAAGTTRGGATPDSLSQAKKARSRYRVFP